MLLWSSNAGVLVCFFEDKNLSAAPKELVLHTEASDHETSLDFEDSSRFCSTRQSCVK